MKACAAFERWQPAIDSRVGVSQYAVGPSASTRAGPAFVLPAQRPASPEIAESPSVTTTGVPTPGPSADAGAAAPRTTATTTNTNRRIMHPPYRSLDEASLRPPPADRNVQSSLGDNAAVSERLRAPASEMRASAAELSSSRGHHPGTDRLHPPARPAPQPARRARRLPLSR